MKKFASVMMLAVVCVTFLTACGSDDDDNGGNVGSTNAAIVINGKNCGKVPYGYFIDQGMTLTEHTGAFMFSDVKQADGQTLQDTNWTYIAIRLPYDGGDIPVGKFSGNSVIMNFAIGHYLNDDAVTLTGWCGDVSLEVKKSGDKYIIDVTASGIYTSTDDSGILNKTSDNLTFHYEGGLTKLDNSQN